MPEKSEVAKKEEKTLAFWQENKIFEETLAKDSPKGEYIFYDGPPFATGLPHYGSILPGTIKDAIPRYRTMCGYHVPRRWGWDCHGLPVENLIEKKLGLKTKKDIETYGIEKFNREARESVLEFADDWKKIIPRLGRFVDMDDDYKTMDASYTETVWWIFKTLYDKGLIYEGYKSMHICPRCQTSLANFEVSQGYKDVQDISVTVKLELIDEPGTFLLAWTTTPWTLPGNVALAVNPGIVYAVVEKDGDKFIVAKDRVNEVFGPETKILSEISADKIISRSYKPLFGYFSSDEKLVNRENGWKVYSADFVTTEEGTGIVHIAPAFGEEDMELGKKNNLPFVQHVGMDGLFRPEVTDFAGLPVKPIEDPTKTDIEILKFLAGKGLLFAKGKVTHSYPHCWRCDTPLLNYATSSWFVKVTEIRDQLVKENEKIDWIPEHIKEGRFGRWLEGARDWAISRSRFWGAPVPVWKCDKCKEVKVVGSLLDLKEAIPPQKNKYFLIRHGQAEGNLTELISSDPGDTTNHLTDLGRKEAALVGEKIKAEGIDLVISSDLLRTKETAEIIVQTAGLEKTQLIFDPRLREVKAGVWEGKTWKEFISSFPTKRERLLVRPEGGESVWDLRLRVGDFLKEAEDKYRDKKIAIVSHGLTLRMLLVTAQGFDQKEITKLKDWGVAIKTGECVPLVFAQTPRNEKQETDVHRPYIDDVVFSCQCGGHLKRIPEVFDCWFESGSMPLGQGHYPFETDGKIDPDKGLCYPADFIAEGVDQTRGWFYNLLVLGVALFGRSPFKNVVAHGIVLAEDGQKMSKRLKNYPDPMDIVSSYGADALRLFLLGSPVVRAEDLNFSEKGVAEIYRQTIARTDNALQFYLTYTTAEERGQQMTESTNILDQWILARLNELRQKVSQEMDHYALDQAVRPIHEFVEDLSNWYIRRSRDRFKSDDQIDRLAAIGTTQEILRGFAVVIAPFAPFLAERLFAETKGSSDPQSVHLMEWNAGEKFEEGAIDQMTKVRELVVLGLEQRATAGVRVRQPLGKIAVRENITEGHQKLLADELNVKKVEIVPGQSERLVLDLELTDELKAEGWVRELIRQIQDWRKRTGLTPGEMIKVKLSAGDRKEQVQKFIDQISQATTASYELVDGGEGEEFEVDGTQIFLERV